MVMNNVNTDSDSVCAGPFGAWSYHSPTVAAVLDEYAQLQRTCSARQLPCLRRGHGRDTVSAQNHSQLCFAVLLSKYRLLRISCATRTQYTLPVVHHSLSGGNVSGGAVGIFAGARPSKAAAGLGGRRGGEACAGSAGGDAVGWMIRVTRKRCVDCVQTTRQCIESALLHATA